MPRLESLFERLEENYARILEKKGWFERGGLPQRDERQALIELYGAFPTKFTIKKIEYRFPDPDPAKKGSASLGGWFATIEYWFGTEHEPMSDPAISPFKAQADKVRERMDEMRDGGTQLWAEDVE